ncbi:MAG: hypothetical protein ACI88C_002408 [Acidimicrobiales bacterium]|jgi:hypothetical protein
MRRTESETQPSSTTSAAPQAGQKPTHSRLAASPATVKRSSANRLGAKNNGVAKPSSSMARLMKRPSLERCTKANSRLYWSRDSRSRLKSTWVCGGNSSARRAEASAPKHSAGRGPPAFSGVSMPNSRIVSVLSCTRTMMVSPSTTRCTTAGSPGGTRDGFAEAWFAEAWFAEAWDGAPPDSGVELLEMGAETHAANSHSEVTAPATRTK